ncbi:JAB domain-containing protein [Acetobacter thailandicus]|uniref:JAB domain-containing protein n=1 Tax=Acetobacter thailandicus TaxID=1502842 RepID=UPI001BAA8497|nr:JAB domain-containing protein [Acetobacter thailandicus]MBS1002621.1 DNA repair protein RadC [Acetobacter thailandicus]
MRQVFASTGGAGHRQRMRERVMSQGAGTLQDYEVLEMLLFPGVPRRDTKPLAKTLINAFGSLSGVLSASEKELRRHGAGPAALRLLALIPVLNERLSFSDGRAERFDISNWDALITYCNVTLAGLPGGQLHALFLDSKNQILVDDIIEEGGAAGLTSSDRSAALGSHAACSMAVALLRRALAYHASALITVRLACDDISSGEQMERERMLIEELMAAAPLLSVDFHDHLVQKKNGWLSFRSWRESLDCESQRL